MRSLLKICFIHLNLVFFSINLSGQDVSSEGLGLSNGEKQIKAQEINNKKYQSQPQKALIASAVIPGLGQILNKQIWKSPIAIGAIGGVGFVFWQNQMNVSKLKNAINIRFNGGTDEFAGIYTDSQLFSLENEYTRRRDYSFLGLIGIHMLQCIDAYAAGFLVDFDIGPDLNITTSYFPVPSAPLGAKIILSWP